ncbi:hypothetical protein [Mycoplasmopsis opalescens]|uniref:hypothetical protein n=1 Tax=Mycoplasmopsis opalescens TaxID=114886 RepID=UPI0004A70E5C|nr:hypothetical protein [Mycoplasmopsis opalescens]
MVKWYKSIEGFKKDFQYPQDPLQNRYGLLLFNLDKEYFMLSQEFSDDFDTLTYAVYKGQREENKITLETNDQYILGRFNNLDDLLENFKIKNKPFKNYLKEQQVRYSLKTWTIQFSELFNSIPNTPFYICCGQKTLNSYFYPEMFLEDFRDSPNHECFSWNYVEFVHNKKTYMLQKDCSYTGDDETKRKLYGIWVTKIKTVEGYIERKIGSVEEFNSLDNVWNNWKIDGLYFKDIIFDINTKIVDKG